MPPSGMEVGHVICPIQGQALDLFHGDIPTYEIVLFIGYHSGILHRNYIYRCSNRATIKNDTPYIYFSNGKM